MKGIGGFYYVATEKGVFECRARGIFRKDKITPLVGDAVQISILDEKNKKGSLDGISKRRNELLRPRVANVDQAAIVFAAASPAMNIDLLDRFLLLAEEQGLSILICINKIDLDQTQQYLKTAAIYKKIGYPVICVSAIEGIGIDTLRSHLIGKITVFAGPSGVGKSSLINDVAPGFHLNTGAISAKIERGKHTTRHAELMEFEKNSFIVDSPGFTSLFLDHIPKEELKYLFREFTPFENTCRFHGCSHTHEPDCKVQAAVGGEIDPLRYGRYVNIYQELSKERKR